MPPLLNTEVLSKQSLDYSASLWSIAAGLNKIHGIWKIYVKGTAYLNPDNFFGLSAGLMYETLIGDRLWLKLPTIPFFVMSRFLDLFEQEDAWTKQFHRWLESVQCVQPLPIKLTEDYARYKISWLRNASYGVYLRIQRIAICTLHLALESFKLAMRIMDVVELITLDPVQLNNFANQSVRESGWHIPRCLSLLVKNKLIFIQRLERKEAGIGRALKLLGCEKIKAKDVINSAEGMIAQCEKGLEYYGQASNYVGEAVKNLGKKFIHDWSPESVKEWLREHKLDPNLQQEIASIKLTQGQIHRPPKVLLCYGTREGACEKEGVTLLKQEKPAVMHTPTPLKQNTFEKRSNKLLGTVSPKKIFKISQ